MLKIIPKELTTLEKIKEVFFPTTLMCMECGAELFDKWEYYLCSECLKKFRLNDGRICQRCGGAVFGEEKYCSICSKDKIYYEFIRSAVIYDDFTRMLIYRFKFGNEKELAKPLARLMVRKLNSLNIEIDAVSFVPVTKWTMDTRHYNQSQLLAYEICRLTGLPMYDGLKKVKNTLGQMGKSIDERKKNLSNSMKAVGDEVKNSNVLVIDDVKTTGSTINECAKALKSIGVNKVFGLTFASVYKKDTINGTDIFDEINVDFDLV